MRWWLAVCIALAGAGLCFGQPSPSLSNVDSLEWATCDSSLIVRGHVTGVAHPQKYDVMAVVSFEVTETLKGETEKAIQFAVMTGNSGAEPESELQPMIDEKADVLVFLVKSQVLEQSMPGLQGVSPLATHSGKVLANVIRLDQDGVAKAVSMNFDPLKSGKDVLARTKRAIREFSTGLKMYRFMTAPQSTLSEFRVGPVGLQLAVPICRRLEDLGHKWLGAEDYEWRSIGLQAVESFPSDSNMKRVKKMLATAQDELRRHVKEDAYRQFFIDDAKLLLQSWESRGLVTTAGLGRP